MSGTPQIAIDFRWFDQLPPEGGQFRYSADLICGLAELRPAMRFVVLGSLLQPVPQIANVFADSRWRYEAVPRLTGKGSLYREHWQYFRLLRKLRIDLLHSLHTFVPIYPPVPVVETVHDLMHELFPEYSTIVQSREYRLHKWAFLKSATRAIAISKTTAKDLERLWAFPSDRIDVVYHGPKLPGVSGAVARSEVPMILSPYNLEPRKNIVRLLEAVARLKANGLKFRLVLFGRAAVTEERERTFREEISRLGLESCTELPGRVSDEVLVRLYRECSVFVFPSLYEGFGLPLLEAMSCGARVIAHHVSAMAEVVGDAGLQVDMNDAAAIAGAIEKALRDDSLGEEASVRASEFSRERMARETLAVYRNALKLDQF